MASGGYGTAASALLTHPTEHTISKIPPILPRERVFPVQIGGELFKLSGASISSDAPSYFSQYFLCQLRRAARSKEGKTDSDSDAEEDTCVVDEQEGEAGTIQTLYIDRDPVTFRDIALHLQGYHIQPKNGTHFVRLFADAQFYNLPKLMSQLHQESIFISIGHREFQIPRDILTDPANSPNYFSLGFAMFFSQPGAGLFPGLDREGLLRPPSILPPSVPNRNADTFADLLRLLQGYPVDVRDEVHRAELLRDARYFHFKGLEQRLIPHRSSYNPLRRCDEIALRLENVQKSGLSVEEPVVRYARPHVDDKPAELVLEIGGSATIIRFPRGGDPQADFSGDTSARVASLLDVLASKLSQAVGPHPVRVVFETESSIVLDGEDYNHHQAIGDPDAQQAKKRKFDEANDEETWVVQTGQWRLRVRQGWEGGMECVLVAVKIDALTSERGRNKRRAFLLD